jgi:TatD DNase family protein
MSADVHAGAPAFVDSHCHLADPRYDADRDAVIARAVAHGVRGIVCVGATGSMATNEAALAVARATPGIGAALGIHPHDTAKAEERDYERLLALCGEEGVVAIGETGLDFHYRHSPPQAQREHFRRTLGLARTLGLPVIVHCREAFDDAAAILREEGADLVGGVIHCFTGTARDAGRFLDLGFHISFSGILTFKGADATRAAARTVPDDRLLIETDGPYLAPIPHRGQRNEPAFVVKVAECLAALRDVPLDSVARLTSANAARLFRRAAFRLEPGAAGEQEPVSRSPQ